MSETEDLVSRHTLLAADDTPEDRVEYSKLESSGDEHMEDTAGDGSSKDEKSS